LLPVNNKIIALTFGVVVLLLPYNYLKPALLAGTSRPEIDLAGNWEVCVNAQTPELCTSWKVANLPHDNLKSESGYVVFKRSFPTAPQCAEGGCSLVLKDPGGPSKVELNGQVVHNTLNDAQLKKYTHQFRVNARLYKGMLTENNSVVVTTYIFSKTTIGTQYSPFAIMESETADRLNDSIHVYHSALPFIISLLYLCVYAAYVFARNLLHHRPKNDSSFIFFCLSEFLWMIMTSQMITKDVDYALGICVHFFIRTLKDFGFSSVARFGRNDRTIEWRVTTCLYVSALLAYPSICLAHFLGIAFADHRSLYSTVFAVATFQLPLMVWPHILALRNLIALPKRFRIAVCTVLTVTLAMDIGDQFIFRGLWNHPYFYRLYPAILLFIFGSFFFGKLYGIYSREKRWVRVKDFSQQIAHDIRAPLAALNSLKDEIFFDQSNLEILKISTNRIGQVVNSLVNSPTSRQFQSHISHLDLKANIEQMIKTFAHISGIQLDIYSLVHDQGCKLSFSDLVTLVSGISNLIQNSIDASESSPRVSVTLEVVQKFYLISVKDKGRGFSKEYLSQFGEYLRSTKLDGNGLALNKLCEVIDAADGSVVARNDNIGANVTVRIPLVG
ncbi:MAG: HAMP domain-containing histidine kinase, partial [Proteobacteria bacterium]